MADPDWPPGQRNLFDFGVRRVAEKRPPPEVDQAEVERDVEAKRQARKQREQDAAAAAAAAERPVGRPKGSGTKPGPAVPGPAAAAPPQQLVWVRIVCQPGAPAQQPAAQPPTGCGEGEGVVVDP
jgi:hypothetical protein